MKRPILWLCSRARSPIAQGFSAFALLLYVGSASAQTACPTFDAPASLVLSDIYSDAKGSVEDKAAEQRNVEVTGVIDGFMNSMEQALDRPGARPGDPGADCAYSNFKQWARAGALTVEPKPYNRQGTLMRFQYLVGLEIIALKFRDAKFALDQDALSWLRTLNDENVNFYERASNRGNLRIRAGAAAALHAVIDRDPASLNFQDEVWSEAMAAIRDDGSIEAELTRGQRATVYHMYSFAATLILQSARDALGYKRTSSDTARLKALANLIGRSLCDPSDMARMAQSPQEVPGVWAYGVINGYGGKLLSDDWSKCGHPDAPPRERGSGGDSQRAAAILKQIGEHTGAPK